MKAHIWAELICSQLVKDGFFFSGVEKAFVLRQTPNNRGVSRSRRVIIK